MTTSDNNKIMITGMLIVGALILKCLISDYNENKEHMDALTAEWIEQPTDVVMPSINEDLLKNSKQPTYVPNMQVNSNSGAVNKEIVNSHLIFKDGNIPRDYVTDENLAVPEEILPSEDLLPKDENNTWTDVNPQGTGSIAYKNFLDSGNHIGQIEVLRNADQGFRVQYPNPQFNVGVWQQSTILPNIHIGADSDVCV